MPVPTLTSDGFLPLGRWHATLPELEAAFVTGQDPVRADIWSEFQTATAALANVVHICSMWVGGSFTTNKPKPGDLECVYLVDERTKPTTPREAALFDIFVNNALEAVFNLRLESFVVTWRYRPETAPQSSQELAFLADRGYWDDFWQRRRHGPKGSIYPDDALPERGYVEVVTGGYHAATP